MSLHSTSGCITAYSLTLVLHFINKKNIFLLPNLFIFSPTSFAVCNRCSFQIKLTIHTGKEKGKYSILYINHTDNSTLN